ncbi:conserved hypothetical protein [Methylobacterium sp. 4-46]|uniref:hypothetical protein n=1 Tax=unclassified Methylobacterium TaxID=2615210 RepID=UPI000152DCE9|nr:MULTISPECIES: hypothetical protein [Methylobacterium]ACA20150.1 conserved hypothetical protein [Methylobacterium sp. 4-46]WFT79329.1 hypothetical protein QA634_29590 [Methylobacterium nodulans]
MRSASSETRNAVPGAPSGTGNVVPFRRAKGPAGRACHPEDLAAPSPALARARRDQRSLMDTVYEAGHLPVAASDRETKLVAARLQVYGFLVIEEVEEDGRLRRLRPSEAVRAGGERPWRLSRSSYGVNLAVSIPRVDDFLFEPVGMTV